MSRTRPRTKCFQFCSHLPNLVPLSKYFNWTEMLILILVFKELFHWSKKGRRTKSIFLLVLGGFEAKSSLWLMLYKCIGILTNITQQQHSCWASQLNAFRFITQTYPVLLCNKGNCNFQATLPSGFQEDLAGGEALTGDRRQKREKPEYFSHSPYFLTHPWQKLYLFHNSISLQESWPLMPQLPPWSPNYGSSSPPALSPGFFLYSGNSSFSHLPPALMVSQRLPGIVNIWSVPQSSLASQQLPVQPVPGLTFLWWKTYYGYCLLDGSWLTVFDCWLK